MTREALNRSICITYYYGKQIDIRRKREVDSIIYCCSLYTETQIRTTVKRLKQVSAFSPVLSHNIVVRVYLNDNWLSKYGNITIIIIITYVQHILLCEWVIGMHFSLHTKCFDWNLICRLNWMRAQFCNKEIFKWMNESWYFTICSSTINLIYMGRLTSFILKLNLHTLFHSLFLLTAQKWMTLCSLY